MPDKIEDPSPSKFWQQAFWVAVVLVIIGLIVLLLANVVTGFVIALLGAIFGLGSKVAQNNQLK